MSQNSLFRQFGSNIVRQMKPICEGNIGKSLYFKPMVLLFSCDGIAFGGFPAFVGGRASLGLEFC